MSPDRRKYWFDLLIDVPGAWLGVADRLKLAADRVDLRPIDFHNPSFEAVELVPVQKMLLGLAFENILKGLLVAFGRPARVNGKLAPALATHRMRDLLDQFTAAELVLDSAEQDVLFQLGVYVTWQGRYPIPKKASDYEATTWNVQDQERERRLWDKLYTLLVTHGWRIDPDGKRIPIS